MLGVIVGTEILAPIPILKRAIGASRRWRQLPILKYASSRPFQAYNSTYMPQENRFRDDFKREIGGALVQYDIGAQVSKISLPTDFSATRITGLPVDSSPESVVTLLSELDIEVSLDCVRISPQNGTLPLSADIKFDDPAAARTLCTRIAVGCTSNAIVSQLQASQVTAGFPSGGNYRRVECKKVQSSSKY